MVAHATVAPGEVVRGARILIDLQGVTGGLGECLDTGYKRKKGVKMMIILWTQQVEGWCFYNCSGHEHRKNRFVEKDSGVEQNWKYLLRVSILPKLTKEELGLAQPGLSGSKIVSIAATLFCLNPWISV